MQRSPDDRVVLHGAERSWPVYVGVVAGIEDRGPPRVLVERAPRRALLRVVVRQQGLQVRVVAQLPHVPPRPERLDVVDVHVVGPHVFCVQRVPLVHLALDVPLELGVRAAHQLLRALRAAQLLTLLRACAYWFIIKLLKKTWLLGTPFIRNARVVALRTFFHR